MTITPKQRKIVWISVAILAVIYYTPSFVNSAMPSAHPRPEAQIRPSPFGSARDTRPEIPPAVTPAAPFRGLLGQYQGRAPLAARGMCILRFELRLDRETPGAFAGYSTMICTPLNPWERRSMAAMVPRPISAILTGTAESGAIRFHVDDTIGSAAGCTPTAFVIKPFGVNQVAAEWQDSCHGGTMLLNRSGR
jgi:hypothetical protein